MLEIDHLVRKLHLAVRHNKPRTVRRALEILHAPIEGTLPAYTGWTALMWASYEGFFEVALVLLNHGANANASAADIPANYTPLMLAARQGHILVLRLLLEWGSAIEATMGKGWSALFLAADMGHVEIGLILLTLDANPNIRDAIDYTPLANACQNNRSEFVTMLLRHCPDIDVDGIPERDWTPLMLTARSNHVETAKILLTEFGADPNKAKMDGVTALHVAATPGFVEMVELLLGHGADVNHKCDRGLMAIDYARAGNHGSAELVLQMASLHL